MAKERYRAGSVVIRQGDEGDKFYVVVGGEVDVSERRGDETIHHPPLGVGAFFGEAALLTGQPRLATVTGKTDVELYSLKKADFLQAMNRSGTLESQLRSAFFSRR